jgi:hypothetical protein
MGKVRRKISVSAASDSKPRGPALFGDLNFVEWLRSFRHLVSRYRSLQPTHDSLMRQAKPFLPRAEAGFEKRFEGDPALGSLISSLAGALEKSQGQSRALIEHLMVLADAIQTQAQPQSLEMPAPQLVAKQKNKAS